MLQVTEGSFQSTLKCGATCFARSAARRESATPRPSDALSLFCAAARATVSSICLAYQSPWARLGIVESLDGIVRQLPKPERRRSGSASKPCVTVFQITRLLNSLALVTRTSRGDQFL